MGKPSLVLAVMLIAILLFGCSSQNPPGAGTNTGQPQQNPQSQLQGAGGESHPLPNETPKNLMVNDPELKQIYEAALQPAPAQTSLDKIQESYSAKKISKEDYIVLTIQAAFEPSAVPSQYAGAADSGHYGPSRELMMAYENWDTLSQESKDKISKYLFLTPEEEQAESAGAIPISAGGENSGQTTETKGALPQTIHLSAPSRHSDISLAGPQNPPLVLYTLDAIPGKATIKAFLPSGASDAQKDVLNAKMQWVRDGITDSWGKFKSLLGLDPTEQVYVYINTDVKPGVFGTAAFTKEQSDPVQRCRIRLSSQVISSSGESQTKAGVAHELFHCFQYYIPLKHYEDPDEAWLTEATAVWSENYIYPSTNSEHEYLQLFYQTRQKPLIFSLPSLKKYSDYNFFLYISQTGSAGDVAKILLDSKSMGAKGALNALPDFQDKHADFSLWNWNKAPFQFYSDDPKYPDTSVSGPALKYNQLTYASDGTAPVSLDSGSAVYNVYDIMVGTDVKKLEFRFPDTGDTAHQRHALIRIGGQWIDEQWTALQNRRFCLDRPGEKVEAVVLIYSNSDLSSPFFSQYDVDTTGECPLEITGTTVMETSISAPLQNGEYKLQSRYVSHDVLQYDMSDDTYKLKSRSVSCKTWTNAQGSGTETYLGASYLAGLQAQSDCSGAATINYDDPFGAPEKLHFDRESNTVSVDLDPSIPDSYSRYIRCSTFQKMSWDSTALVIKQLEYSGTCGGLGPPSLVDWSALDLNDVLKNKRLHKEESQTMPVEGGTTTMKISVDYDLSEQEK
jgi:hypothetical protein